MARLNIEECWWTDPRRERFAKHVGCLAMADALTIRMWRLAQEFWKHGRKLIPVEVFDCLEGASGLLAVGLAEHRDDGIYVRGSSVYLDWIHDKRSAGKKGGLRSAKRTRDAKGRLLKPGRQTPSRLQADSKQTPSRLQADSKQVQASSSYADVRFSPSASSSLDSDLKTKTKDPSLALGGEVASATIAETVHDGSVLVGEYVRAYRKRYGEKTRPEITGKTAGQVKNLLKSVPQIRAIQLIQVYLQMDDSWFVTKCHDFSTFIENLTKVGLALDTGEIPGKPKRRGIEEIISGDSHAIAGI